MARPEPRTNVRTEYVGMVDQLPALMAPFGASIEASELADLTVLMVAMELADATLDPIRDASERRAHADHIVRCLEAPTTTNTALDDALAALAAASRRRGIALAPLVRDTLANAERTRTTRDPADYVACVEREGELCVELALRFFAPPPSFARFFRAVGPPANLLDKLVDLHADRAEGTLAIAPDRLRLRLAARIAAWAPRVVASHPEVVTLARWSAHWIGATQPSHPRPGRRIAVVGTSGSGKSFVARALADKLGLTYVSNDAIIWGENWQPTPPEDRVTAIDAATRADGWTFDGNVYDAPEDLVVLSRADTIVWIDLPRPVVLAQIARRTLRRVVTRERLWHNNVETWRGAPDVIRWSMRTFSRRREIYGDMITGTAWPPIRVWLRSRADVDAWLASL